jgi:excisionase family DNA binding protein
MALIEAGRIEAAGRVWVPVNEAAAMLCCQPSTMYRRARMQTLRGVRIGRYTYFGLSDIERFRRQQKVSVPDFSRVGLLTGKQLAALLRVTAQVIQMWSRDRGLPSIKFGRARLYDVNTVMAYIEDNFGVRE